VAVLESAAYCVVTYSSPPERTVLEARFRPQKWQASFCLMGTLRCHDYSCHCSCHLAGTKPAVDPLKRRLWGDRRLRSAAKPFDDFSHSLHCSDFSILSSRSTTKAMATRRIPPRAKTAPIETLHSLLTTQEAERASRLRPPTGPYLQNFSDIPPWQQDNHFILTHYRPACYNIKGCLASLFYLHNESVNIHSHLLGAFLFFFISLSMYTFERYSVKTGDIVAFSCFFAGAIICLGISAGYHMISNHSPHVSRLGNQVRGRSLETVHEDPLMQWPKLDYAGIVALITGSFVPSVYYGFHCEPTLQKIYWAMVGPRTLLQAWL